MKFINPQKTILVLSIFSFPILLFYISSFRVYGFNTVDVMRFLDYYKEYSTFAYTSIDSCNFFGSPSYFPGLSLMVWFLEWFLPGDVILNYLPSIFIVTFLILTAYVTNYLFQTDLKFSLALSLLLTPIMFKEWLWYAMDLKPDTLILILVYTFLLFKDKIRAFKPILFSFSFILFFIGNLLKQQFIIVSIVLIIFFSLVGLRKNINLIASIFASLLFSVFVLSNFPHLFDYTVLIQKNRDFLTIPQIGNMIKSFFENLWPFVLLISICIIRYIQSSVLKRYRSSNVNLLLFLAIVWLLLCTASGFHYGGTIENLVTGLLLFLPFGYSQLYEVIRYSKYYKYFLNGFLICFFFINFLKIIEADFDKREVRVLSDEISYYFENSNLIGPVVFDSKGYFFSYKHIDALSSDITSVMHFESGGYNSECFYQNLKNGFYSSVIVGSNYMDINVQFDKLLNDFYDLDATISKGDHILKIFRYKS